MNYYEEDIEEWEEEVDAIIDNGNGFNPEFWMNSKSHVLGSAYDELWKTLVPESGNATTIHGEILRCIGRLYYDRYNNGFCNMPWDEEFLHIKEGAEFLRNHMNAADLNMFIEMFEKINHGGVSVDSWEGDEYLERVLEGAIRFAWFKEKGERI